jgi:hypothetical protein
MLIRTLNSTLTAETFQCFISSVRSIEELKIKEESLTLKRLKIGDTFGSILQTSDLLRCGFIFLLLYLNNQLGVFN